MSVDTILTRLMMILLYEFDYDDVIRWLIDMYTFYMMILFDSTYGFTIIDIGRSYGLLWSDLGRGRIVRFYGPLTEAVVVGV